MTDRKLSQGEWIVLVVGLVLLVDLLFLPWHAVDLTREQQMDVIARTCHKTI